MPVRPLVLGVLSLALITAAGTLYVKYDDFFTIPKYREVLVQNFKDPSTAQFRNESLRLNNFLCGEVNSKNSYGAYTGFKRFVLNLKGEKYIEDSGYVGTPAARPSFIVLEMLESETKALQKVIEIRKVGGKAERPEGTELVAIWNAAIFTRAWNEYCGD